MKTTKRIISLILCAALIFSVAVPAFAAGKESSTDLNKFVITKQPEENTTVKRGDSFTLSVEVNVPADVYEVKYQWFVIYFNGSGSHSSVPIEGKTEPTFVCTPKDSYFPKARLFDKGDAYFECRITAYDKDEDGNIVHQETLTSRSAHVAVRTTMIFSAIDWVSGAAFTGFIYSVFGFAIGGLGILGAVDMVIERIKSVFGKNAVAFFA